MECHNFLSVLVFLGINAAALFEKTGLLFFCGDSESVFNDFKDQMNFMEE